MNKILVFKTSVCKQTDISKLKVQLDNIIKNGKWNFDLEDCDKILRIESNSDNDSSVICLLNTNGFDCIELED
jgi:hypothetical protein